VYLELELYVQLNVGVGDAGNGSCQVDGAIQADAGRVDGGDNSRADGEQ
jgi:hypothetical protein